MGKGQECRKCGARVLYATPMHCKCGQMWHMCEPAEMAAHPCVLPAHKADYLAGLPTEYRERSYFQDAQMRAVTALPSALPPANANAYDAHMSFMVCALAQAEKHYKHAKRAYAMSDGGFDNNDDDATENDAVVDYVHAKRAYAYADDDATENDAVVAAAAAPMVTRSGARKKR